MTRLDQLTAEQLGTMLAGMENELNELKNAPQYVGGSSVVFFESDSGAAYDWSGVLPQRPGYPAGNGQQFLIVSAVARKMETLYATVWWNIFVGSPTAWYRPSDSFANMIAGGNGGFRTFPNDLPNTTQNTAQKQWLVQIVGDTTSTVYFKPYVDALDKVNITVTVAT